ncbi:MAG TPA: sugar ABC transporter permease, partial [Candidatus Xenobia bacterium]
VFLDPTDGTLNRMLGAVGGPVPDWLQTYPMLSLCVYNTWRGTAFSMLLFDAALRGIPVSFYEAAAVSGASALRQFWDVTLPMLKPQLMTDMMMITLWTFNDFSPYLLTGGGPAFRTEVLPIFTYRVAFRSFDLGYGAALSMLLLVVNLGLAVIYMRSMKKKAA